MFLSSRAQGHLPGDKWMPDKCTTCTCKNDTTIFCTKTPCPAKPICGLGFVAVTAAPSSATGSYVCCEKLVCVPEKSENQTATCPQLIVPKCSTGQTNKMINDTNGCSKFICGKLVSVLLRVSGFRKEFQTF